MSLTTLFENLILGKKTKQPDVADQTEPTLSADEATMIKASQLTVDTQKPIMYLLADEYTPERGIRVEMDWNDQFIQQLRNTGVTGSNDDEIVLKWLYAIISGMHDEYVPQSEQYK